MTPSERDWIEWRKAGEDPDTRPDGAPDKIPDRWWDDNQFALDFAKAN